MAGDYRRRGNARSSAAAKEAEALRFERGFGA
jgi:hypothetical protein